MRETSLFGGHDIIFELLKEIYTALQNDCRSLAVMGIRALLEQIMILRNGDKGTFRKNLEALRAEDLISTQQIEILQIVIQAGHASIHRGYRPTPQDVLHCVDITEGILRSLYLYPKKAEDLVKQVPLRRDERGTTPTE